jgi:hypothetical protein
LNKGAVVLPLGCNGFFRCSSLPEGVLAGISGGPKSNRSDPFGIDFREMVKKGPKNPVAVIIKLKAKKDSFLSN